MIADRIGGAIMARGECTLALCGGSTPVPIFESLIGAQVRWHDVAIYFGDERAVPPDDVASNFRMARQALLDHVPVRRDRIHRMKADAPDRDGAARDYERLLPLQLDLLLLGVGPDGHTASLFPGSPALSATVRRVLAVASPPPPVQPQVDRMTITPAAIEAAREIVVMVAGADKAAVLARILDGPVQPTVLPAQLARRGAWILDQAAAGQLQRRGN
jgi:6-phosphogluconolactonase